MIKKYFIAGLLVWLPLLATLFVLKVIFNFIEGLVNVIPEAYQPVHWLGIHIPGFSVLISVAIILLTGLLLTNFLGNRLVALWEKWVNRIPMVRTIYSSTKQVLETVLSSKGDSFRKVVLVEYPRKECFSIGFLVGSGYSEVSQHHGKEMLCIFIPTTPNPTSGFLILLPKEEVKELNISVEDAFKFVISLGTLTQNPVNKEALSA